MTDGTELVLPPDFGAGLACWTGRGWRLGAIWPADDPQVARLGGTPRLRLKRGTETRVVLRRKTGEAGASPAGHRIEIGPAVPDTALPDVQTGVGLRRLADGDPWVIGRAGMQYRDLVPDGWAARSSLRISASPMAGR